MKLNPEGYIDSVIVELDTKLRNFKTAFGIELIERVERRTPVRTGHLRRSWGFIRKDTSIDVYNNAEYSAYVETGTPYMAPRAMLRTTLLEVDDIAKVAAAKVGLKTKP